MATKEKIKRDVVDNLYWDMRIDASDVKVEVREDGSVSLSGKVPSNAARTAATTSTWSITGVTDVENNLAIEYPSTVKLPSDSQLESNIRDAMLWDPDVDSTKIDISVSAGVVTLEGDVDSYWKISRAEDNANLLGVVAVKNKLAVVPEEDILDEDIAEDIVNALTRNYLTDIDDITVKVEDGSVTLTGSVTSWTAFRSAEDTAFFTAGVREVDNQLQISA